MQTAGEIEQSFASLRIGAPKVHLNLALFPLFDAGEKPSEYLLLDDALDRWILGEEGFTARLNPDAKVYNQYDQLMRLDEWLGREA